MENQKRVPLISVLIILLCISVCIGATYAYFASSVASNGNKVKAGKLDVDLQLLTDSSTNTWLTITESADPVFNYELWEPGYTAVKVLRVVNNGNLAVKWEARFISNTAVSELADVIQVDVKTGNGNGEISYPANVTELLNNTWGESKENLKSCINSAAPIASGTLLSTDPKASTYIVIALHMPIEADNTYQDQLLGEFDIEIVATQFIYESDAFGSDYDEGAKFPCEHPATEVIEGYEPTYEQTGLTDGKKCIICTEVVEQQEEIPMLVEKEYYNLEFSRHEDDNGLPYYSVRGKNGYNLESTDIVIPSTYYGYPVTEIEDEAFYQFSNITSIEIPDSITSIGSEAFRSCYQMPSIEIPNSVTSIGEYAFSDCGLESLELPDSVTSIGEYAFHNNGSLKSVTLPNSITNIEWGTFAYCDNLTDVTIPDSVESIDGSAFYDCFALENVTIGDGVKSIGRTAFFRCRALKNVTFGENSELTSIGNSAFIYCENLQSITIPNSVTSIGEDAFYECASLTSLTVPNGVTSVGVRAFSQCTSLANVTLPDTLTRIESGTFGNCIALTSITVGNNLTSIGSSAFEGCYMLKNITLPDTVTSVENKAFYRCNLVNFPFGESSQLTTIGVSAFYYCDFKSVIIPDSVITIGERAFQNCDKLTNVTLGDGLTDIDYAAFGWCTALKNVTFGSNGPMSVNSGLFNGSTALTAIYITDLAAWCNIDFSGTSYHPLSSIENLYLNDEILTGELVIPDHITKIGAYTFYGYDKLTSVEIGNGVTSIGMGAFENCIALESVTIGNNVTSIGSNAFYGCDSLESAAFGQSEGWYTGYYEEEYVTIDISATNDLTDHAIAATCLKDTYCWYDWSRNQ